MDEYIEKNKSIQYRHCKIKYAHLDDHVFQVEAYVKPRGITLHAQPRTGSCSKCSLVSVLQNPFKRKTADMTVFCVM
jgi:hypothetical protein